MQLTLTYKLLPKLLWSFARLLLCRRRYSLVRAAVYISTGHWQKGWDWSHGDFFRAASKESVLTTISVPIPRVQLTLVRYYAHPEALITRAGVPSK